MDFLKYCKAFSTEKYKHYIKLCYDYDYDYDFIIKYNTGDGRLSNPW